MTLVNRRVAAGLSTTSEGETAWRRWSGLDTAPASSSSRTCSGTQKFSRISVRSLLYCFQLIRRQILHFSNIRCCPALNRRSRFRSVVPNLCHRISCGTLPWDKYECTRLAHWLDHWPNVLPFQQNPTCLDPTNSHLVASISIQNQTPSSVSRLPSNVGLIRRHKILHVRIFESRCSSVSFTASLDLNIDVFESIIDQQTLKLRTTVILTS